MTEVSTAESNTGLKSEVIQLKPESDSKEQMIAAEVTPPATNDDQKNTGQPAKADVSSKENSGHQKDPRPTRNGTKQSGQNNRRGNRRNNKNNGARHTQRMLAVLASKSELVDNETAQQFSHISPTVEFKSHTLVRYLTSELHNIMDHAAAVIPFIQVTQRHQETRGKFDEFTEESLGMVKEVCSTQKEMIDILKSEDARIEERLKYISMSDPREFKLVFLNEFFWDYITMLMEADIVLHDVEKIILTGIYKDEMEQVRSDIINSVKNAFKALEFVSKLRTRRDGGAPIKLDQFRKIQTNFKTRMGNIVGTDDDTPVDHDSDAQETEPTQA
ncbi:hypothetical protein RGL50_004255 [Vibrio alginolyticus]|nr:hypothetical protein [Vibrio alginolyticus]